MRACMLLLALAMASCAPAQEADAPEETYASREPMDPELAMEMRQVPVTMYMTSWCPICGKAREWLKRNGFEHTEHDVERDPRAAKVHLMLNPRGVVPMFDVDGKILRGFSPYMLRHAIREAALDRRHQRTLAESAR